MLTPRDKALKLITESTPIDKTFLPYLRSGWTAVPREQDMVHIHKILGTRKRLEDLGMLNGGKIAPEIKRDLMGIIGPVFEGAVQDNIFSILNVGFKDKATGEEITEDIYVIDANVPERNVELLESTLRRLGAPAIDRKLSDIMGRS